MQQTVIVVEQTFISANIVQRKENVQKKIEQHLKIKLEMPSS